MNKAIFLDRDGTIIEDKEYLDNTKDIKLLNNVIEGLTKLQEDGFLLIMISNQSGVARGYFTIQDVEKINNELIDILKNKNIIISGSYYCPHHKDGIVKEYALDCNCRKPKTGMIEKAVEDFDIDLKKSYYIGDKDSDMELAKNVGITGYLIKNSKYDNNINTNLVNDILDAAEKIIEI